MIDKWQYFPDENEKEVTLIERETRAAGIVGSLTNSLKSSATGAAIAGAVSGVVGLIFGSMFGGDSAEEIIEEVMEEGKLSLGGGAHFAPGLGFYVDIPKDAALSMLESRPEFTANMINGINGGVQNAIGGTIGGAAVGAVKGGWVDYIIKERELSQQQEAGSPDTPTIYYK